MAQSTKFRILPTHPQPNGRDRISLHLRMRAPVPYQTSGTGHRRLPASSDITAPSATGHPVSVTTRPCESAATTPAARAFGWRDNAHRRASEGGTQPGAGVLEGALVRPGLVFPDEHIGGVFSTNRRFKNFRKIFHARESHPGWPLPASRRTPNRFRFSARIARCIAVIGGTGGFLHGRGWGRVPVCVHAVWRGGLPYAAAISGWRLASSPNSAVLVRRGQRRLLGPLVIYSVLTPCVRQGFCWL